MFGPKKQKVEAKVSPAAVFSAAISNAVAEAQKAGVSGRTMGREFENRRSDENGVGDLRSVSFGMVTPVLDFILGLIVGVCLGVVGLFVIAWRL
jgi:hypothetical protein